ncbi:hypothetical protein PHYSODRAFT_337146 [Phytophthora sojae]|uniref:Uncharacterized protein n=1 Tax=Phytophthora sojae (strain P6497) TaxID=1094619 RepID=G4ZYH6_PHYSP|nr:hypothetical protein PHYSODRAFT_337146 [Phytophthora sojae]EGZ12735.1 hypothetical protein PHYSODRAFT_337146 [Phytophthora sojae]|eukprot:XP_009533068.1 hypothetical protein PHYSODRAFT_337146 [Phytophthora sojae]
MLQFGQFPGCPSRWSALLAWAAEVMKLEAAHMGCSPSTRASTRSVMGALSDSEASPLVHSEFRRHSLSSRDKFKRKGDATASERIKLADSK